MAFLSHKEKEKDSSSTHVLTDIFNQNLWIDLLFSC